MRNLMALLMTCPAENLSGVADAWSIELPRVSRSQQAAALSREMLRDASAHRLWDSLDEDSRTLLTAFATEPEQKLSSTGITADDPSLRACLRAGILWASEESEREGGLLSLHLPQVPDPALILPPELQRLLNRLLADVREGDTSTLPLEEQLTRLGTGELENLAAYWGLASEPGSYTRDELVESLLGRISNAPTEQVVAEAAEPARQLYAALVEAGGCAPTVQVGERAGLHPSVLRDAVGDLGDRLLALEMYDGEWKLYLPQGPVHALPQGGKLRAEPERATAPTRHVPAPAWACAWDLLNLSRAFELRDIPSPEPGELPRPFFESWETALLARPADPHANLRFLLAAAEGLSLVERRDGVVKPAPRCRQWAESTLERQSRQLVVQWVEAGLPGEGSALAGAAGFRNDPNTLKSARHTVLEHLAACEPETWYSVESLIATIRTNNPHILRPQNRLVRDLGAAGARKALEDWRDVEGRWIKEAVLGPLSWTHVVESAAEPEPLFRVTPDGAWLCGRVPRPPSVSTPPRVEVSEEGRIRVTNPDSRLIWALACFARPARSGGHPLYLVDRRSIARARSAGMPPSEVVALLRRYASDGAPPKLIAAIWEWGREPHRIEARPTLLVSCETEAGVEELLSSPIVRSHSPRRVGEREVLLVLGADNLTDEAQVLIGRLTRSGLFAAQQPS